MSILSLDLTTRITLRARVKAVVRDAADFLDDLCRDDPVSVWLVGSRAGSVNPAYPERGGKTHEMSDWDFVVVGEGFDEVELEKIERLEEGEIIPGIRLDCPTHRRCFHNDIIFSQTPPVDSGVLLWENGLFVGL